MGRFATKLTRTTSSTSLKYWLLTKAGMAKRTRVVSVARNLIARITGQPAVALVGVCVDAATARRLGRARQRQTLALLHARLGWRPVRGGSGGSSGS